MGHVEILGRLKFGDWARRILETGHVTSDIWGGHASEFWDGRRQNFGTGRLASNFGDGLPRNFGDGAHQDLGMGFIASEFGTGGIGILGLGASDFGDGSCCLEIWDVLPQFGDRTPRNLGTGHVGIWDGRRQNVGTQHLKFGDRARWNFGMGLLGILRLGTSGFWDAVPRNLGTCRDLGT